ncbi:hypothetical protein PFISCL1PPCAC_25914, partial [Pristionchus fissidentatus]
FALLGLFDIALRMLHRRWRGYLGRASLAIQRFVAVIKSLKRVAYQIGLLWMIISHGSFYNGNVISPRSDTVISVLETICSVYFLEE